MDMRRKSQIAWLTGAVLLVSLCPDSSAWAQFAPVNKARSLEKSVLEGDEEVRKIKTGQAEIKSAGPVAAKPAAARPNIAKKAIPAKSQPPPKAAAVKAATAKPAAPKPAPAKSPQATAKKAVAAVRPARKPRPKRIRYVKPTPLIVVEGMDSRSLISGISEDGRFVYMRVTPDTVFRMGNQTIPATAVVDGMKLDCWGAWDKNYPDVYTAKGVLVRGRLDDFALRIKINEACKRLSRGRAAVAAAPVEAPSAPVATPKPEEKKADEKKPDELKPGEPKPEEPKPVDPAAPPANTETPPPGEPKPAEPANP